MLNFQYIGTAMVSFTWILLA